MARSPAARPSARPPARPAARVQPQPVAGRHRRLVAWPLAGACCVVYLSSLRCSPAWDTIPARLLPFSIVREGNLDLNEFDWLQRAPELPYFLRRTADGKLLSKYPVATPLLAAPLAVPAVWWLQQHTITDDDVRFRLITVVVERLAAALIAAASVALVFLALCRLTDARTALVMAVAYGLATNTWATSSQAMWQHGLAELSLAGLSMVLLSADTSLAAVGAGVFTALGVAARPTMIVFAPLALLFMWRERRRHLLVFLALPILGAVVVALYNARMLGSLRGGYAQVAFSAPSVIRFLGLLISPNRGLFIFTPIAALALPALRIWRHQRRAWVPYLSVGILGYVLLYASFGGWWGGHTYGPRFLIDILPALAVCAVPTVERLHKRLAGRVLLALLVVWSVTVQALGVYFDFDNWNHVPVSVDIQSSRVWDWTDPQILRAWRGGWHGTDLGPLLWQMLTDPRPALLRPLEPAALAGEIEVKGAAPLRYGVGRSERLEMRLTNRGGAVWPAFSDYGDLECRVIGVWKRDGAIVGSGSYPFVLPRNLGPGESVRMSGRVDAPMRPGVYELDLMLVQLLTNARGIFGGTERRVAVQVE